jgi:DNA-binding CsgD family transcriptional regulator
MSQEGGGMAQHYSIARVSDVGVREIGRLPSAGSTPLVDSLSVTDARASHDLYWQGQTDGQREPMALLDTAGRVIRTTLALDEALYHRHGAGAALTLRDDTVDGSSRRLCTAIRIDQPALDAAIARAVRAVAPVAAAARCPRRDGGAAVVVTLQPLPRGSRLTHADGAAATLTLIDPLARPPAAMTLWREAFDLTPSEAAVAALLVAGHSLESAAATRGSRAATLRVHLRHVFAKTSTARQSDLVALLLRMG